MSVPDQYRYTDFSHASLHAGCDRRTSEGLEEDITSVRTSSDKYSDRGVESSFAGILSGRSRLLFHGDFGLYLFCNDCNIYIIEYCSCVPDSLISSIGTTMVLAGAYVNQENPAMKELTRYHDEMVIGFSTLIESRDSSTGGHVKRTTQYVKLLAEELRRRCYYSEILTKDYMSNLLKAAPMHDVGKIAVPDAILQKPGRLTPEEFEIMKLHAQKGGEIIQESFGRMGNEQYLEIACHIAKYHHEKWNGKGYPEGLKRKEIPLCARIMAIADVFDAVSADRCYRAALPLDECFEIIQEGSGQDFDPILAEVFLDLREEICRIYL